MTAMEPGRSPEREGRDVAGALDSLAAARSHRKNNQLD